MLAKDLESLTNTQLVQFLNSFDHVFCDCDGVIMIKNKILPQVNETIKSLHDLGKSTTFVSNNTSLTTKQFANLFEKSDFTGVDSNSFITPAVPIVAYLKQINFTKKLFVIGMPALRNDLQQYGFEVVNESVELLSEHTAEKLAHELNNYDNDVGAVVICLDFNMTLLTLNRAINYLQDKNIHYIITGNDKTIVWKSANSQPQICLGAGYVQQIATSISGRLPIGFGKPMKGLSDFLEQFMRDNNYDPERVLFIGDSLELDICFAKSLGIQQLLVLSGNTSLNDLTDCTVDEMPSYYIENLSHLGKLIKNL